MSSRNVSPETSAAPAGSFVGPLYRAGGPASRVSRAFSDPAGVPARAGAPERGRDRGRR
ncbi:hypothetical protein A33M_0755 [Rhodovulum sp. PH10]|nr:hypothetical protein A33M_0755 [Rhodovulum sp. PH10]